MKHLTLVLIFTIWCGFHSAVANNDIEGATTEKLLGGADNIQIVTTAKEITVFRIISDEKKYHKKSVLVDGLPCQASPVTLAGKELENVVSAFSDSRETRRALTALAKKAFPKDADIQSLGNESAL